MLFCCLWIFFFFSINFFEKKSLSGIPSLSHTIWMQIRPNSLSGLIWVQTVCTGYQQMTKVATGRERVKKSVCTIKIMKYMCVKLYLKKNTCKETTKISRPRWLSWMHRTTGDQEVVGSTPTEVGSILSWRLIM